MKGVSKISYTISYNIYAILALPFRFSTKGIALNKFRKTALHKICQSRRSSFTNRDFRAKIAMNLGG
jgi:hypothetical protein